MAQPFLFSTEELFGSGRQQSQSMTANIRPPQFMPPSQFGAGPAINSQSGDISTWSIVQNQQSAVNQSHVQGTLFVESVPDMSFERTCPSEDPQKRVTTGEETKSTSSEVSRGKRPFPEASPFSLGQMPRHRQTEAATRTRYAEIFAPSKQDQLSSDFGFYQQVFSTPLCEDEGDVDEAIMSPQLTKADFLNGGDRIASKLLERERT